MNDKMLLNLALLGFVLLLAGIAFIEPGKEDAKVIHLSEVETEGATQVELQNKEKLLFEKRGGRWWLTAPFAAPANDVRVHQLLEIPRAESEVQYPLKKEELAKYELDKPKAILTIGAVKLLFGGSDPLDMRRYVQAGDTLHLVNDDFFHHLIAASTDFVDKKLLPDDDAPNEILLPGLKATLGADGAWMIEPPSDAAAGMADLLSAWRGARAIEVKRTEQPAQGDIVRIGFPNGKPAVEFVIAQREPDLLLTRNDWGLQYLLAADSAKQLLTLQKPQPAAAADPAGTTEEEDESGEHEFDEDLEAPLEEEDDEAPLKEPSK
ncbi:MAG: DUF4340 domain-containing protein [Methylococcaceae bacterium]|nr:DUF4340 domain-containing protein [Methylococcaceae bacterium]